MKIKFRFNGLNVMLILTHLTILNIFSLLKSVSLQSTTGTIGTQTITLLRQYADTLFLQCQPAGFDHNEYKPPIDKILWLNEKDTFNIRDKSIIIDLSNVIPSVSQSNLQIDIRLSQLSCGYLSNGRYQRIRKWQLRFIEYPLVNIRVKSRPEAVYYKRINDTFAKIR